MNIQAFNLDSHPIMLRNRRYLKEFFAGPVILILAILNIASGVLEVVSSFVNGSVSAKMSEAFLCFLQDELDLTDLDVSVSTSISIPLMAMAFVVAFLVMYCNAKKSDPIKTPSDGVAIFRVLSIITLVASILCAALLLLVILFLALLIPELNSAYKYGVSKFFPDEILQIPDDAYAVILGVLIAVIVVSVLAVTLMLVYSISQYKFATSMRNSLNTPELTAKGSKTFGVTNVIFAVFSCISLVGAIIGFFAALSLPDAVSPYRSAYTSVTIYKSDYLSYIGITVLTQAVTFAAYIYMSKFAFGYDRHIKAAGPNGENIPASEQDFIYCEPQSPYSPQPDSRSVQNPVQNNPYAPESAPVANAPVTPAPTEESTAEAPVEPAKPAPAFCPECGTPVSQGQVFCSECGTKTI